MEFIETKLFNEVGDKSEQKVWKQIKSAFAEREGLAYWQYPLFIDDEDKERKHREADIIVLDRFLGIIIIEVKGCYIDEIESIQGNSWVMSPSFYTREIWPYKQCKNYLEVLWKHCKHNQRLNRKIAGRAIIGLPNIEEYKWNKQFSQLVSAPPVILADHLGPQKLLEKIRNTDPIGSKRKIKNKEWEALLAIIAGSDSSKTKLRSECISTNQNQSTNCLETINNLENSLMQFDYKQESISKVIPPGPQRIRGIAGSGKSVMLCQRAAHLYLAHPDWKIALVFFTRSLYSWFENQLCYWLRRFSDNRVKLETAGSNLQVLHAWGSQDKDGLFSKIRGQYDSIGDPTEAEKKELSQVKHSSQSSPTNELGIRCRNFLNNINRDDVEPLYDAILIDEGQDLVVPEKYKLGSCQPFYWLAWCFLKPISEDNLNFRRLYWAYDEAQSLELSPIPTYEETFGKELGADLSGQNSGPTYKGGSYRSEIMRVCYRTPAQTLTAAHALGMGLLRSQGIFRDRAITSRDEWDRLGYKVEGDFRSTGSKVKIRRPPEYCGNSVPDSYKDKLIDFKTFSSREYEISALTQNICYAVQQEGLNKSQHLLVIPLGNNLEEQRQFQSNIANNLINAGVDIYIPSADNKNITVPPREPESQFRDIFWWTDAVTISRVHRAKGNEAYWVFVTGLDRIAISESDRKLRNMLFVAMTRTKAWLSLSGLKFGEQDESQDFYHEINKAISNPNEITFSLKYEQNN